MIGYRAAAACVAAILLAVPGAFGETAPPPEPQPQTIQPDQARLDQILAPIALYPDTFLADVLMAATYPRDIVEADHWVQERHAMLGGNELIAALDAHSWDPSVKSLTPFGSLLQIMDERLDWTKSVGEAFLADQKAVMESVQRLRTRAKAADHLASTPRASVVPTYEAITIEPPASETVYLPVYDPTVVYGEWPYPDGPPVSFVGAVEDAIPGEAGFKWMSAEVAAPLRHWNRLNWARHFIFVDPDRFAAINNNRPPIGNGVWRHDPTHRLVGDLGPGQRPDEGGLSGDLTSDANGPNMPPGVAYGPDGVPIAVPFPVPVPVPDDDDYVDPAAPDAIVLSRLHRFRGHHVDSAPRRVPNVAGIPPQRFAPTQDVPRDPRAFQSFNRTPDVASPRAEVFRPVRPAPRTGAHERR
jgi:hypothetical protein